MYSKVHKQMKIHAKYMLTSIHQNVRKTKILGDIKSPLKQYQYSDTIKTEMYLWSY